VRLARVGDFAGAVATVMCLSREENRVLSCARRENGAGSRFPGSW
jgi:hypothetical protein